MTSRPWQVEVGREKVRSFETEQAAIGYTFVSLFARPIGTVGYIRNRISGLTYIMSHNNGWRILARKVLSDK